MPRYHRCVCNLTLSDPGMCDSSLRDAMSTIPEKAMVLIEAPTSKSCSGSSCISFWFSCILI